MYLQKFNGIVFLIILVSTSVFSKETSKLLKRMKRIDFTNNNIEPGIHINNNDVDLDSMLNNLPPGSQIKIENGSILVSIPGSEPNQIRVPLPDQIQNCLLNRECFYVVTKKDNSQTGCSLYGFGIPSKELFVNSTSFNVYLKRKIFHSPISKDVFKLNYPVNIGTLLNFQIRKSGNTEMSILLSNELDILYGAPFLIKINHYYRFTARNSFFSKWDLENRTGGFPSLGSVHQFRIKVEPDAFMMYFDNIFYESFAHRYSYLNIKYITFGRDSNFVIDYFEESHVLFN
ncbi:unnamed protein product [Brachionus calyciflorus]|uniref:Galectin domain-containing protein n=1 Tax=Brachionus calyciflorus TaxID=104777 RepID=A0A814CGQ0_9BILA|nr:unnamed protein product [Brachionus calyciflorus]